MQRFKSSHLYTHTNPCFHLQATWKMRGLITVKTHNWDIEQEVVFAGLLGKAVSCLHREVTFITAPFWTYIPASSEVLMCSRGGYQGFANIHSLFLDRAKMQPRDEISPNLPISSRYFLFYGVLLPTHSVSAILISVVWCLPLEFPWGHFFHASAL